MNVYPELFKDKLKIAFLHVPKTGGKTFRQICKKQFKSCKDFKISNQKRLAWLWDRDLADLMMIDLIHGHFPYYAVAHLPRRFKFFTWLRDPVDRVVSQYHYWRYGNRIFDLPSTKIVRETKMSFQDYMDNKSRSFRYWIFAYTTFFGAAEDGDRDTVEGIERCVEQAVRTLTTNFDFVGITERYKEGLIYLQKKYGFRTDYIIQNVTPAWAKVKAGITDEQKEELRAYLKPEYLIYDIAKKIFEERINGLT